MDLSSLCPLTHLPGHPCLLGGGGRNCIVKIIGQGLPTLPALPPSLPSWNCGVGGNLGTGTLCVRMLSQVVGASVWTATGRRTGDGGGTARQQQGQIGGSRSRHSQTPNYLPGVAIGTSQQADLVGSLIGEWETQCGRPARRGGWPGLLPGQGEAGWRPAGPWEEQWAGRTLRLPSSPSPIPKQTYKHFLEK